jgi:AraC-like DNA-binding protein
MDHQCGAMALARMPSRLGALLKSEVAIEPLSLAKSSSFRSFASRTISVIDVQGEPIAMHKSASHTSDVHVLRLRRGSVQLEHEDGCTTVKAGQFAAYRGARALEFRHEQSADLSVVVLSARALEHWLPDWQAAEFVNASAEQAEGGLCFDIARDLLERGARLRDAAAVELVGDTVTRLLARSLALTSLAGASSPEDLAEAHRRKVRHFCRGHLGSPRLSVDSVARATGISRASLHRLFRDQPHTLMQWVQLERLEACKRLLDAPGMPRRTLTEIALSQGFKSPAHFSAAFRRRYGAAPRDYRAEHDAVRGGARRT